MNYICPACVGEPFLGRLVASAASASYSCDYCESDGPATEVFFIAERCNEVISTFYELSSDTMAVVHFGRDPIGECLFEVIQHLTGVSKEAVEAIVEVLSESIWYDRDSGESTFGDDPYFVRRSTIDSPLLARWSEMESSLRTEARYVNPKVALFMEQVFGDISEHVAGDDSSVLVDAGPGSSLTTIYRARVFQSERSLEKALQHPERNLGAPPSGFSSGGRMNASGQPAFYGALDERTAIAEVRPPVGSWAAVAKFNVIRPLKLLDITLLERAQMKRNTSLFDPSTVTAAQRLAFLCELASRISTPVMPENQEHSYLITQVVADYLATHPSAAIDGIIYRSAQRSGADQQNERNIVLFHKAAITHNAQDEGATAQVELREFIDEEPGSYFSPKIVYFEKKRQAFQWRQPGFQPDPALELVRNGIQLHHIKAVSFQTEMTPLKVANLDVRASE